MEEYVRQIENGEELYEKEEEYDKAPETLGCNTDGVGDTPKIRSNVYATEERDSALH